ncbi:MAG: hypothetical protein QNK15_10175, partial [Cycloclasticus sp.]|nr:hypothetical protein [Cycloclasticus sp.]
PNIRKQTDPCQKCLIFCRNEGDHIRVDVSTNSTELSFSDFLITAFLKDRGAQNLELFEHPPSFL